MPTYKELKQQLQASLEYLNKHIKKECWETLQGSQHSGIILILTNKNNIK